MWSQRPSTLKAVAQQALQHGALGAFIREFLDEFYSIDDREAQLRALAEEPPLMDHPTANAYLAAVAEHLCLIHRLAPPDWTQQKVRFLKRAFFPANLDSLKALCIAQSPTAFRRRMIFVDAQPLSGPRKPNSEVG